MKQKRYDTEDSIEMSSEVSTESIDIEQEIDDGVKMIKDNTNLGVG